MKILQIQRFSGFAGSEKYILELSEELKKYQITSEVLCIYASKDTKFIEQYIERLKNRGITYYTIVSDAKLSWKLIKEIKEVFEKGNYDLIQSHLIYADIYSVFVKLLSKFKITILSTKHGYSESYYENDGFIKPYVPYFSIYYYISFLVERFIDYSFGVSEGIAKVYKYLKITKEQIPVIHHGLRFVSETEGIFPTKNDKRFSRYQLLVIGRLAPLKGQVFAIEALEYLLESFSCETKLVLVGGDSRYEKQLQATVKEKQLEDFVIFEGFQKNINQYFDASDVVIIPSRAEAFGLVFLEAFAAHKAVVAFDVPAANEILNDGINGYLVPPFDTKRLAQKIQAILESPELRTSFEEAGYKTLKEKFTIDLMIKKTVKLYNYILTSKNGKISKKAEAYD